MENVVPGALQRLRAADIIRMAGLTAASLGQEYSRLGVVQNTQRHGARLSGRVELLHSSNVTGSDPTSVANFPELSAQHAAESTIEERSAETPPEMATQRRSYAVEVEIQSPASWTSSCSCNANTMHASILCAHAAALLYQWLARPASFLSDVSSGTGEVRMRRSQSEDTRKVSSAVKAATQKPERSLGSSAVIMQQGPTPLGSILDILTQLQLSELRNIAREYELSPNGMNKQQIAETILEVLRRPEAVRRVALTLEKAQRQLLAALALAGGSMTDDDLRGMFERFSLGPANQLQSILVALQSKAMLFRTSLNSSSQQRIGLSGALLDVGWHIPLEVRSALRVPVPVTPFHEEQSVEKGVVPVYHDAEPYGLLADLLLVARVMEGYRLGQHDDWQERTTATRSNEAPSYPRTSAPLSSDGVVSIPAPSDMPSSTLLAALQANLPHSSAFLRFAVSLLRLADLVHKDDHGSPYLRLLPNAAQLLLGSARETVMHDFFELWLTQASYDELYDLQEEGVRVRCRATSLNVPILRAQELDEENSEARQALIALLAQVPSEQWVSFPAFARFVYRLNPLFLQKRQRQFSAPHWWLEIENNKPLRPLQLTDWLHAEMHYLSRLVAGPLHWWGACDVALAEDGRLLAFRLTPLAAWLFNGLRAETPADEEGAVRDEHLLVEALEIIDAKEVLVRCSPDVWPVIELLETFMETRGVQQDRLRYALSPRTLSEALSRGHRPAYLLELLRQSVAYRAQQDEPAAQMVAQFERWIASYGRVRIYTGGTLLETADTVVMRELSATIALQDEVVQAIHPTLLILKNSGAEHIIDDLKRRGQTPLLHDEDYYGAE